MCGIIGYVGPKQACPILVQGLKRLEYRGYDSAGLALIQGCDFVVRRAEGKLDHLVQKLGSESFPATIGVGHTRWATHGRPNETNAHPHLSRDVAVVHNGIIENFAGLRDDLRKSGVSFSSETDSEVICHLIQRELNAGMPFLKAFQNTLKQLHGSYGLVVLDRNDAETIYVARQSQPLVLGVGQGESFVASDIPAILMHTNRMIFLNDGESAVIRAEQITCYNQQYDVVQPVIKTIEWTLAQSEKSGFAHYMLKEIHEQPRVISDTVVGRLGRSQNIEVLLDHVDELLKTFVGQPLHRIHIVGCGTSWHAGLIGRYWIESLAAVPVSVELASEFRYHQPLVDQNSLVVAISQSGETADTLAAVREAQKNGAQVVAVCNVIGSTLERESAYTLSTHAGPEIGVASTKAFTSQMTVLLLLACKLGQLKDRKHNEVQNILKDVTGLPHIIEQTLELSDTLSSWVNQIGKLGKCIYIARGIEFPVMLEAALKIKEISYIHAEGFAAGELKHGPIALIETGVPVIAVVTSDVLGEKTISNLLETDARGAAIFVLRFGSIAVPDHFHVIDLPLVNDALQPFVSIVLLQCLAYQVAIFKGTDIDQPRNLAKSVTVE